MKQSFGQKGAGGRFLALALALIMLCSVLVPAYAAAADEQGANEPVPAGVTYIFHVGETVQEVKVLSGNALTKPADPTPEEGKVFVCWRLADGQEFTSFGTVVSTTQDETVNLYAHFEDAQPQTDALPTETTESTTTTEESKTEESVTPETTESTTTTEETKTEETKTEEPTTEEPKQEESVTPETSSTTEETTEPQPTEPQPTEPQPAEPQPAEGEPTEGEEQTLYTTDAQTAEALYERLMAVTSLEEMNSLLDNLTEEQNAMMLEFSEDQNAELAAKMNELGAYEISTLATPNKLTIAQGDSDTFDVANNISQIQSQSGSYAKAGITVSYSGKTFTVTVSSKVLPGKYDYTVMYSYRSGNRNRTATETVEIIVTGTSTEAGVYFLKDPSADPDDNSTGAWYNAPLGPAYVNTDGATWANGYVKDKDGNKETIPDKNIFNPGKYVRSMPTGLEWQADGSYKLSEETHPDEWNAIFGKFQGQLKKQYPDLTITKEIVEGIYLTPYKISKNNNMNNDNPWPVHIDCTVSLKVKGLISVRFIVTKPDEYDYDVVEFNNYVYKEGPLIAKTAKAPLDPEYSETIVGTDGKTYRFDGWYNEAGDRVTAWDDNPDALYTPTEEEMANGVVEFYAYYVPETVTLTIKKHVTGNLRDPNKQFEFNYSYIVDTKEFEGTFTLADGEDTATKTECSEILKNIPVGTSVTIWETDYKDQGYTTTYTYKVLKNPDAEDESGKYEIKTVTGKSYTFTVSADDNLNSVTFINDKNQIPDTGILLDSWPYLIALALAAAGAVLCFARRRRDVD